MGVRGKIGNLGQPGVVHAVPKSCPHPLRSRIVKMERM